MEQPSSPDSPNTTRWIATTTCLTLAMATPFAQAAPMQAGAGTPGQPHLMNMAARSRIETRIADLHTKLHITRTQEGPWKEFADVMRANADAMTTLAQSRKDNQNRMTALDDMKSYRDLAQMHADGVTKLVPPFEALYNSMTDAQKANADAVFRSAEHHASPAK
ncbi:MULTISPECIES: Spy/CpxP family protein refolding chaperone [unclassified Pandoraea]|uniref:Spy/CpxP family protein refolding chaperone n=1 Tax=unclassified Pandoraea TaxID=2624094 RepID=UPI0020167CD8|nr:MULTISPECIES: Spy/CpxP family protein refolding chaperone [unclassified Pandoraea]